MTSALRLPTDPTARKEYPVATGALDYFPDALCEVAHCSYVGNEQHNAGMSLHWDRSKSTDEADALLRHFMARGTRDTDGIRHSAKAAWRALALLQKELEMEQTHAPVKEPGPAYMEETVAPLWGATTEWTSGPSKGPDSLTQKVYDGNGV